MRYRRICIVGLDAYGLLSGEGDLRYVGGESVQHVLLARAWRDLGHEVTVAGSVSDGLAAAAAIQGGGGDGIDLVLSDLGLPDASGLDLMRELSHRYGLKGIALSGYGMEEDLRRSREAGFEKP